MEKIHRYLYQDIEADLRQKMVFIGGPRQVGKTTLSLDWLGASSRKHSAYLNWDELASRDVLLKSELPAHQAKIILDEIHKYAGWRNLVKGFYDRYRDDIAFLITGSARLDYYRKGGDSLQGRYHYYRLHPFSLMELNISPTQKDVEHLLQYGGFPEPLLAANKRVWRRWQKERMARVVYDDLRDLEQVKEISLLEVLIAALPDRVGSPLSVKSLRDALGVAHETVERWLSILENLYVCFRILPYGAKNIRAVKKEKKLYLWDWSVIEEPGVAFENMVACQLLKYCHYRQDTQGYTMELQYLRDTDGREVDFVVLQDRVPLFAVECKLAEKSVSKHIHYFKERTPIPEFFQLHMGDKAVRSAGVVIQSFRQFCIDKGMP